MAWLDQSQEIALLNMFRTVIGKSGLSSTDDIVRAAKGNSHCEFYRVCKGVRDSDVYVCYFIAARIGFDRWEELREITDCNWSTKYSKRNCIIVNYIKEHHSSEHYSVEELDIILEANGLPKLRERKK